MCKCFRVDPRGAADTPPGPNSHGEVLSPAQNPRSTLSFSPCLAGLPERPRPHRTHEERSLVRRQASRLRPPPLASGGSAASARGPRPLAIPCRPGLLPLAYCLLQHTTAHGKINVYLFRKLLWEYILLVLLKRVRRGENFHQIGSMCSVIC